MTRSPRASDLTRWQAELAGHPDLQQRVHDGFPLKDAARLARGRDRDIEIAVHNQLLEAQQLVGWERAPDMACPNGHRMKCYDCAHGYRFGDDSTPAEA